MSRSNKPAPYGIYEHIPVEDLQIGDVVWGLPTKSGDSHPSWWEILSIATGGKPGTVSLRLRDRYGPTKREVFDSMRVMGVVYAMPTNNLKRSHATSPSALRRLRANPRCEDYPCCGHGPPPHGDGGGCPDSQGRFNCVLCGRKLAKGASSSICVKCQRRERNRIWDDPDADYRDNPIKGSPSVCNYGHCTKKATDVYDKEPVCRYHLRVLQAAGAASRAAWRKTREGRLSRRSNPRARTLRGSKMDRRGVEYVERGNIDRLPRGWAQCGVCGRCWNDDKSTSVTPVPSARCPFEDRHVHRDNPRRRRNPSAVELFQAKWNHGKGSILVFSHGVEGVPTLTDMQALEKELGATINHAGYGVFIAKRDGKEVFSFLGGGAMIRDGDLSYASMSISDGWRSKVLSWLRKKYPRLISSIDTQMKSHWKNPSFRDRWSR